MKSKKYPTVLSAIALLLVLMIAPVSTAAFAQTTDADEPDTQTTVDDTGVTIDSEDEDGVNDEDAETDVEETDESDKDQRKELREQYREERKAIKDYYKDERKNLRDQYKDQRTDLREQYKDRLRDSDISVVRPAPIDPDRVPDVKFDGMTDGYVLIGGQAWESYIKLVEGSGYHVHNGMWKVKTSGEISVAGKMATLDLKGFAKGNKLFLHGSGELEGDQKIRLSLKGFFAPTGNTEDAREFAIAFTQAGVHNINTGQRLHLMQVGEVTVTPNGDAVTDFATDSAPFETLS